VKLTSTIAFLLGGALSMSSCALLNQPAQPAAGAGAGNTANAWSDSMEAKRLSLERATRDTGIVVLRTEDNQLQVNVPSDFSFDTDSAAIKAGMRPVLDALAEDLKTASLSHMLIHIVGFADSRGADAVNEALSLARATSVRKHLEGRGIAAGRIEVEGRGESQPLAGNDQRYGRALNRRVEIYLREPAGKS
jgi:outer membrane protein OmpA-like peptidoglycan-associated protein